MVVGGCGTGLYGTWETKKRAVCELEGAGGMGAKGLTMSPAEMPAWPHGPRAVAI